MHHHSRKGNGSCGAESEPSGLAGPCFDVFGAAEGVIRALCIPIATSTEAEFRGILGTAGFSTGFIAEAEAEATGAVMARWADDSAIIAFGRTGNDIASTGDERNSGLVVISFER